MKGIIKYNKYFHTVNGELTPFWDIFKDLPQGWQIDNQTDAPVPNCVFINNGESILSGKKETALLIVDVDKFNNYINNKNKNKL